MSVSPSDHGQVSPGELTRTFARIGLLSFGGPAGQIAMMHRVLVDEKAWLGEKRFLHALNYCMLLPGPEAMQLAIYCGWLMHGVRGGLVAGLLFILPGAVVMITLSAVYLMFGNVPAVAGLLFGLKAAVLAIVVEALIRVAKRAIRSAPMAVVAGAAFAAIAFLRVPFPAIVLAAAIAGALYHAVGALDRASGTSETEAGPLPSWTRPSPIRFATTVAIWLTVWLAPLALLLAVAGKANVFFAEAAFFSKMAVVTFGGAYAVLAYVAQQAVDVHHWLMPDEMLTGLGLAETTPGPLILVLVFVGFLGGARLSGFEAMTGGIVGALTTLWFTFVPCFLWIFAGAPYAETVRKVPWLAAALSGVTAAVVGVVANLALWFSVHVLFADVGQARFGPIVVPVPEPASVDLAAAAIAIAAGFALIRFHVNLFAVLGAAALAGVILASAQAAA